MIIYILYDILICIILTYGQTYNTYAYNNTPIKSTRKKYKTATIYGNQKLNLQIFLYHFEEF